MQPDNANRARRTAGPVTLVDVLRHWAVTAPQEVAMTFLCQGSVDGPAVDITYGGLDDVAKRIAVSLRRLQVAGGRALLLYPPGLDFIGAFFGCAYAKTIAVPVYPPDPLRLDRTLPRLRTILRDADTTVVLTTAEILGIRDTLVEQAPELANGEWIATDRLSDVPVDEWQDPQCEPDTLAYLQYTSGATATPRGVMVSHGNLVANLRLITECFEMDRESMGVIWLPPYHDMGLIGGILQPVYTGSRVILFSPMDFLQRPLRWLQAVSHFRGTVSGGPNFAYELCVRKIGIEERRSLDLSSWQVAFCGAEPVRAETFARFVEAFSMCGFRRQALYPCYGLAEATLIVSGGRKADPPIVRPVASSALECGIMRDPEADRERRLVGCGTELRNHRILIVDPQTLEPCAEGKVGEIWTCGPSVTQGYWNRPVDTQNVFRARPKGGSTEPFLRTGDLGFFHDGELFVTGRLKDLIVIRGRNHSPEDIELTVEECYVGLRRGACAAFAVDGGGEERLVVVQAIDSNCRDTSAALAAIREAVTRNHQLRPLAIVLVAPSCLAKTPSGKIQRHACRASFLGDGLKALAEWRETSIGGARSGDSRWSIGETPPQPE